MAERWLRWYDGTVRDGKFRIAAELSDVPVCTVIGVWAALLEDAATNNPRGIACKGLEHHSMFLGIAISEVEAVWNALERTGTARTFRNGDGVPVSVTILNWDKRQFETDGKDPTSKTRKEKWKQTHNWDGTPRNATERTGTPETETETDKIVPSKVSHETLNTDFPKDAFEKFYELYPRKQQRKAALRAFEKIRKTGEVKFSALIAGIQKIPIGEPKFIPYPASWLNAGAWDDEVSPKVNGHKPESYVP